MMTNTGLIIIKCNVFEWEYYDEYEIEKNYDSPQCCGHDMTFCCHSPDDNMEIWKCSQCEDVESFFPGMYGTYSITMNGREYAEYKASERQRKKLIRRYGTDHPQTIRDYFTSDKRSS